ncbi:hypothetical protein BDQ17DRAFT_1336476 [Cyathus striatus]|nr:hypothetical protein BDQ17DRAFT_1336476 [Cyathus striatus]
MYSVYHNIRFPQSYIVFQGDEECGESDYVRRIFVPTIGREIFENVGYMISNWGADALSPDAVHVIYYARNYNGLPNKFSGHDDRNGNTDTSKFSKLTCINIFHRGDMM